MFTVDDRAAGPHDASLDHERLVLEARDVEFDWAKLPFHYVPNEPFATHAPAITAAMPRYSIAR